jgi:hypothetical protein
MATLYSPKIITDGLSLYIDSGNNKSYPGSGNTWYDMGPNALHFTGNASYITANTGSIAGSSWGTASTSILNTDIHSIFFRVKFNSNATYPTGATGNWEKMFTYNPSGTDRSPGVWRWPSNRWIHWRYDPSNSGCDFGKAGTSLDTGNEFDLNKWYHVGVTKNGGSTVMFVNGLAVGAGSVSNPKTAGNAAITVMEYYTNPLLNLDNLMIYNRVLSQDEVLSNFTAIRTRFGLS